MSYPQAPQGKDPQIWELAQKRASFKSHLATYLIVNTFLWLIWAFTDGQTHGSLPWPAWSTFGWGIGLFGHYRSAYVNSGQSAVEREYEKLQGTRGKE